MLDFGKAVKAEAPKPDQQRSVPSIWTGERAMARWAIGCGQLLLDDYVIVSQRRRRCFEDAEEVGWNS